MPLKIVVFVLCAIAVIYEWQSGYFRAVPAFRNQWSWAGTLKPLLFLILMTFLLLFFDSFLIDSVQQIESAFLIQAMEKGAWIGRGIHLWFLLICGYFLFFFSKNHNRSRVFFGSLLSAIFGALICTLLKHLLLRARPDSQEGVFDFLNWPGLIHDNNTYKSFPSGDVAVVASAISFLFFSFHKSRLRWVLWLIPLSTAFSRVFLNRHWPSDVFFSFVLGVYAAAFVWSYQKTFEDSRRKPD